MLVGARLGSQFNRAQGKRRLSTSPIPWQGSRVAHSVYRRSVERHGQAMAREKRRPHRTANRALGMPPRHGPSRLSPLSRASCVGQSPGCQRHSRASHDRAGALKGHGKGTFGPGDHERDPVPHLRLNSKNHADFGRAILTKPAAGAVFSSPRTPYPLSGSAPRLIRSISAANRSTAAKASFSKS